MSFNYCPVNPSCLNSAVNFLDFMDTAPQNNGYFGPACVASNMMGRMVAISHQSLSSFYQGDPAKWNPTTIANYGRIAFALTPDMLARLLPLGRYNATQIVGELGYPVGYTCGSTAFNYTDCEYRLIVWTAPCPADGPGVVPAYWGNLESFLRSQVYGAQTPNLANAISSIQKSAGLIQNYTGCDPNVLFQGAFNTTIQQMAGCTPAFMNAMQLFSGSRCTCSPGICPRYTPSDNCTAENTFLNLTAPTVEQLRAYLMTFEAFNPYFTGYGYTASSNYYDPMAGECWYPNSMLSDLGDTVSIVRIFNGTACGTNCT